MEISFQAPHAFFFLTTFSKFRFISPLVGANKGANKTEFCFYVTHFFLHPPHLNVGREGPRARVFIFFLVLLVLYLYTLGGVRVAAEPLGCLLCIRYFYYNTIL